MKYYYPYLSDKPNKKFFIFTAERGEKIYFGDSKYEHYTEGHLDKKRKDLYKIRHIKNENFDNPNTAGFWSYHFLWEYPTYKQAYKNILSLLQ